MQIIRPFKAFTQRAENESWTVALNKVKSGSIVSGFAPQVGKSTMDIRIFLGQAQKVGLLVITVPHNEFVP